MKKKLVKSFVMLGIVLVIAGCSDSKGKSQTQNKNSVADVVEQQTKKENVDGVEEETENTIDSFMLDEVGETKVDINLTTMGSDMVYATVYQFLVDPDTYIGKTVCMQGKYSCVWYEPTAAYYHYVIIEDAMACCASGIEFVWEDGTHSYPEEYPKEGQLVEVTGVFETYYEEVDDCWYCRLNHATLEVME